jgi:micrococcal nuclease
VKGSYKIPLRYFLVIILAMAGTGILFLLCTLLTHTRDASPDHILAQLMPALPTSTGIPVLTASNPQKPTSTLTPFLPVAYTATSTWTVTASPTITISPTITLSPTPLLPEGAACLPPNADRQPATLRRVIDGDTIEVELADGSVQRVRYIGINTPGSGERLFNEASAANNQLLAGYPILLVKDVSEVDRYDRLLRYVLAGEVFVNYELVRLGLAEPGSYPPDTACDATFFAAAQNAQATGVGMWVPLAEVPNKATGDQENCDPSYPTVCIPPYPPDLDCKDIPYRRFQVNPPDPHYFDGDYDGVGCESN